MKNTHGTIEKHIRRDPNNRKMAVCSDEEGRPALTEYTVLRQFRDCALLHLVLHTDGRIRSGCTSTRSGHPIVGDPLYGSEVEEGMMLHAKGLSFTHPTTGERMTFTAKLPRRFFDYLNL